MAGIPGRSGGRNKKLGTLRSLSGCRRPLAQLPPTDELPTMPARFADDALAAECWRIIVEETRLAGTMHPRFALSYELFADALADYRRERDDLARMGHVSALVNEFSDGKGSVHRRLTVNIIKRENRKSLRAVHSFANDFGLSPLTVSRLLDAFQSRQLDDDPFEEFLNKTRPRLATSGGRRA